MRRLVSARSLRGLEDCTVLASGLLSLIFARWRAKSREREACALAVGCTPETSIQASSESCPTNCTSIRRPEVWMSFCWESCLSSWVIRPTSLRLLLERARWRSHNRFGGLRGALRADHSAQGRREGSQCDFFGGGLYAFRAASLLSQLGDCPD